jgi:ribosome recycling factor
MTEEVNFEISAAEETMAKAIDHLKDELGKLRAGKANPAMVDGVRVDYYGTMTPVSQIASINTPDPRTLAIQPWEKNMIAPICKAIVQANLGFTPTNDGAIIRINIPALTEERRRELVKKSKEEGEKGKISVRNARRDANEAIKKLQKDGLPEDVAKTSEEKIQKITDGFITKIDETIATKEKDVMTV